MSWDELRIDTPRELAERWSDVLFALGAAGLQEDFRPGETPPPRQPWDTGPLPPLPPRMLLRAWFENADRDAIGAAATSRLPAAECVLTWEPVPDEDWDEAWKRNFPPIRISARLLVAPPWEVIPGAIVVEPGQGFGTGQHPTTRQALTALDDLVDDVRDVLDVGCGSGIIAIAAARLGATASGIDVDPVAVRDAERNAATNRVLVRFSTTPIPAAEPADLVVANLHAELLVRFAPDLVRLSRRWLVLAGILADREDSVRAAFDPALVLADRTVDGEWVSLRYHGTPP